MVNISCVIVTLTYKQDKQFYFKIIELNTRDAKTLRIYLVDKIFKVEGHADYS